MLLESVLLGTPAILFAHESLSTGKIFFTVSGLELLAHYWLFTLASKSFGHSSAATHYKTTMLFGNL